MNLRELINGLENLSQNGKNDKLRVVLNDGKEWQLFPEIVSAFINQDPDYNFDESNCGPDEWIELKTDNYEKET